MRSRVNIAKQKKNIEVNDGYIWNGDIRTGYDKHTPVANTPINTQKEVRS